MVPFVQQPPSIGFLSRVNNSWEALPLKWLRDRKNNIYLPHVKLFYTAFAK